MSETRIRWESDGHNGFEGYAGTSERLFDVWYAWSDFGGVSIGEWALSSQLPQPRSRRQPHGRDPEALKAEAERWLSEFISSLGAAFRSEPAGDEIQRLRDELARYIDIPGEPAKENDR